MKTRHMTYEIVHSLDVDYLLLVFGGVCVTGYSLDEINNAFFHYVIFFSSCLYMFILSGHVLETTHDH